MIIALAFLAGFAIGWVRAAQRGGTLADKLQYGFAFGMPLALIGVIVTVTGVRMGWDG